MNSYDFKRDLGAEISPEDSHYDLAKKVGRSVFKIEFRKKGSNLEGFTGTGWLIAPGYIVTAAHNVVESYTEFPCIALGGDIIVHTFDGETLDAELVWHDEQCTLRSDLAVLKLAEGEEEIDAVPMKIAQKAPEKKDMLLAMGAAESLSSLGAWTVTAGPALGSHTHPDAVWLYHQVPALGGMSGGPIFNSDGEVVSIVGSSANCAQDESCSARERFGVKHPPSFRDDEDLFWIYGFEQRNSDKFAEGPDPDRLRQLFDDIPDLSEPENAGDYRDDNEWERADHPLGEHYSPFPVSRFDEMNRVFREARKGTVQIKVLVNQIEGGGSGFIYDDNTVITAAHVVEHKGVEAKEITITTQEDGKSYPGEVKKKQFNREWLDGCDIAVIKTAPGALSGYKKLAIADSSPRCGDSLVQIGSAGVYNQIGSPQGLAVVYTKETRYTAEFISRSVGGGMSGGPIVNSDGEVVTVSSLGGFGRVDREQNNKPGHLYIHTWLPVYASGEGKGTNAKTIKKIITEDSFRCQPPS